MEVTATQFRQNIYKLLEKVYQTGESITIKSKGHVFKLTAKERPKKKRKFDNLKKRNNVINGDPDDIIYIDWMNDWKPEDT